MCNFSQHGQEQITCSLLQEDTCSFIQLEPVLFNAKKHCESFSNAF